MRNFPRRIPPDVRAKRVQEIARRRLEGESKTQIADNMDLTPAQISWIMASEMLACNDWRERCERLAFPKEVRG